MTETDAEYYGRRARAERALAERTADECARRSHARIAEEYEKRAVGGPVKMTAHMLVVP